MEQASKGKPMAVQVEG